MTGYKRPHHIEFRDELPKTPVGKVLRREIVADLAGLEDLAPLILSHHERVDGAGYPQGLTGEEIPLGGKILAVIDSYTVMTEGRPYRVKCSHEEALAELAKNRGTAFDPDVIDKFIAIFKS